MATQYQVNITMTGETVTQLLNNNFYLYGFKVVQSSSGGSPVVWFNTMDFALTTAVSWTESYQAFTSRSQIIPHGQIVAEASYPADLGQVLTVSNAMGIGEVTQGNSTGGISIKQGISILNQTSTPFTCGISQQQPNGTYNPICAFNLFGHNLDVIVPIEQVYLMFSSLPIHTGTVVEQSYGPGILINLSGSSTQSVSYDINGGWTWPDEASWAAMYPPNQNLVPLLIQPVASLGPQ